METYDLSYFLGKSLFGDDSSQNTFVYQPTFNMLELKTDKGTEYVIGWKSKGVYYSKLVAFHGAFLPNIKDLTRKIGIQFNNAPLVVEKNNYTTKIVSVYIVYDLDNWPKFPLRKFILKNCLFGATAIGKNNNKDKYVFHWYEIAFDGKRFMEFWQWLC